MGTGCVKGLCSLRSGGGSEKVLKIDRPSAGGFLGLTGLWPEGCGIAIGHACGVRVQRVQKVHRVQRVWYRPTGDEYKDSVTGFPFPPSTVILSDSEGWSVDQPKGRPFYGQA